MLKFPNYAVKCLEKLQNSGYEANFVGGCVRDALMGRHYDDIDITTNATPDEVIAIFNHTIPTGIAHGTVTVIVDGKSIEVTTYRTEGSYSDSRHPDSVNFVSNLSQDLSRRDFTVNAIAYDPKVGITDYFDGIGDIKTKTLRTVGVAEMRFQEDALRILRAFRFASVLDMDIEESTKKAAFALSGTVNKVSGERVLTELIKLSSGRIGDEFINFINTGALIPFGIDSSNNEVHYFRAIKDLDCDPIIKFAIFVSFTKHNTDIIKDTLKPSNAVLNLLSFLDYSEKNSINLDSKCDIKYALYKYGEQNILALMNRISILDPAIASRIFEIIELIKQNDEPYSLKMLCLNGNDLKEHGFNGKAIGDILEKALKMVIEDPSLNDKIILLNKLL